VRCVIYASCKSCCASSSELPAIETKPQIPADGVNRLGFTGKSKGLFDINWPFLGTLANIWVSGTLNKIVPRLWDPPAMLNGFTRKTTEYSYIVWCRRRDIAILACFCMAVIALGIEGVGWLVAA